MKKLLATLLVITSVATLTACGASASEATGSIDDGKKAKETYTYSQALTLEVGSGTEYYTLEIYDDTKAKFTDASIYGPDRSGNSVYMGTYERKDGMITFTYADTFDKDWTFSYNFYLDGKDVTSVEYASSSGADVSTVVGTYTGDADGELGELVVSDDGTAVLTKTESGLVYDGNIYDYEGNWDFMGYNEDTEENIDWMVTFDGDTFTYVTYTQYMYGQYAGTFTASGAYGDIEFTMTDDGQMTAEINYDGQKLNLVGNFYANQEEQRITDAYLSDTNYVYSFNFYFEHLGNGSVNYSGNVSTNF